MPEKDPLTYTLLTYAWVFALSAFGGIANYIRKINIGVINHLSITQLCGDILISAFSGLVTFYLCESAQIDPMAEAALVGISGHMGSRAIFAIERMMFAKRNQDVLIIDNPGEKNGSNNRRS